MAHEIEQFSDGTAAFASAREIAWHRLGTVTEGAMTAEEALKLAYLDTEVKVSEEPIQTTVLTDNGVSTIKMDDKFLTYRTHPKTGQVEALGVVGTRYVPIQNAEAFEFLNYISDESGAVFETAGSIKNGRQVFVTMKFPKSMELAGGQDVVDYYLVAANSHDGSKAFTVAVTPVRVVCTNTLALGLQQAVSHIALKHTVGAKNKIQQARETLGMVWKYQEAFEEEVQRLVSQPFTDQQFVQFTQRLIVPRKAEPSQRQLNKVEEVQSALMGLWNSPTQQNVAGTKWAAWNAAVEYADWLSPIRGKGKEKDEVRATRAMGSSRDKFKQRAYALLTK